MRHGLLRRWALAALVALVLALALALAVSAAPAAPTADPLPYGEAPLTPGGDAYEAEREGAGRILVSDAGVGELWRIDDATGAYEAYGPVRSSLGEFQEVRDARAAADGRIWWSAADRLTRLDPASGAALQWTLVVTELDSLIGLDFDAQGRVWAADSFGVNAGLHRLDPATNQQCSLLPTGGAATDALEMVGSDLWLAAGLSSERIMRVQVQAAGGQVTVWPLGKNIRPTGFYLEGNTLWWADRQMEALVRLAIDSNVVTSYTLPGGVVDPVMVRPANGRVWFATASGRTGFLDPAAGSGSSRTLMPEQETIPLECVTIAAPTVPQTPKRTGTMAFAAGTLAAPLTASGFTIYTAPAGADLYGMARVGGRWYVVDHGRQQLLRLDAARLTFSASANKAAAGHGEPVAYAYTATFASADGTGAQAVAITDPGCAPVLRTSGDSNGNNRLDPGETWRYACTAPMPPHLGGEGSAYTRAATLQGQALDGETLQPRSAQIAVTFLHDLALGLSVAASPTEAYHGQTITYAYTATFSANDGSGAQAVAITDPGCAPVVRTSGDSNGNNRLDPGETWRFDCSAPLPAHQTGEGSVYTRTVTLQGQAQNGAPLEPRTAVLSVELLHDLALDLLVSASPAAAFHGAQVTYHYTATAIAQDPAGAANVVVTHTACSPVALVQGDANNNQRLEPTETWRYTCQTTLPPHTPGEPAAVTGTATISGKDGNGAPADGSSTQTSVAILHREGVLALSAPVTVAATAGATVTVPLTLAYTSADGSAAQNVVVAAPACAALVPSGGDANGDTKLQPGETWRYNCLVAVPAGAGGSQIAVAASAAANDADGLPAAGDNAQTLVTVQGDTPNPPDNRVYLPQVQK